MSEQTTVKRLVTVSGQVKHRLLHTGRIVRGLGHHRGALAVLGVVTVAYLVAFLYMLRNLIITTEAGVSIFVVDAPLSRMFDPAPGAFLFQPVALIEAGVVVLEFSPLNFLLGLGIAFLVGLNLSFSYLAITQPRSCGMSASAGVFASIPALLAGSACCAPVIFLILGIQATGVVLTAFVFLLPVSVALLVLTLVYLAGKINPTVF